jgi:hypothetical protein
MGPHITLVNNGLPAPDIAAPPYRCGDVPTPQAAITVSGAIYETFFHESSRVLRLPHDVLFRLAASAKNNCFFMEQMAPYLRI